MVQILGVEYLTSTQRASAVAMLKLEIAVAQSDDLEATLPCRNQRSETCPVWESCSSCVFIVLIMFVERPAGQKIT